MDWYLPSSSSIQTESGCSASMTSFTCIALCLETWAVPIKISSLSARCILVIFSTSSDIDLPLIAFFISLMNFIIPVYCNIDTTYSCDEPFLTKYCIDVADFGNYEIHSVTHDKQTVYLLLYVSQLLFKSSTFLHLVYASLQKKLVLDRNNPRYNEK